MYIDAKKLEMVFVSAMAREMADYGDAADLSTIVLTFDETIADMQKAMERDDRYPHITGKNDVNTGENKANAGTKEKHTPDYGTGVCEYCGRTYKKTSGNQKLCPECKEKKKSKKLEPFRGKAYSTTDKTLEHVNDSAPDDIRDLAHELAGMEGGEDE